MIANGESDASYWDSLGKAARIYRSIMLRALWVNVVCAAALVLYFSPTYIFEYNKLYDEFYTVCAGAQGSTNTTAKTVRSFSNPMFQGLTTSSLYEHKLEQDSSAEKAHFGTLSNTTYCQIDTVSSRPWYVFSEPLVDKKADPFGSTFQRLQFSYRMAMLLVTSFANYTVLIIGLLVVFGKHLMKPVVYQISIPCMFLQLLFLGFCGIFNIFRLGVASFVFVLSHQFYASRALVKAEDRSAELFQGTSPNSLSKNDPVAHALENPLTSGSTGQDLEEAPESANPEDVKDSQDKKDYTRQFALTKDGTPQVLFYGMYIYLTGSLVFVSVLWVTIYTPTALYRVILRCFVLLPVLYGIVGLSDLFFEGLSIKSMEDRYLQSSAFMCVVICLSRLLSATSGSYEEMAISTVLSSMIDFVSRVLFIKYIKATHQFRRRYIWLLNSVRVFLWSKLLNRTLSFSFDEETGVMSPTASSVAIEVGFFTSDVELPPRHGSHLIIEGLGEEVIESYEISLNAGENQGCFGALSQYIFFWRRIPETAIKENVCGDTSVNGTQRELHKLEHRLSTNSMTTQPQRQRTSIRSSTSIQVEIPQEAQMRYKTAKRKKLEYLRKLRAISLSYEMFADLRMSFICPIVIFLIHPIRGEVNLPTHNDPYFLVFSIAIQLFVTSFTNLLSMAYEIHSLKIEHQAFGEHSTMRNMLDVLFPFVSVLYSLCLFWKF